MLSRILSNDFPRSRVLALLLVLLLIALAGAPFIFPGIKALNVAAKVLVFIVLVASFDLLLGYTGIVSFAHTMFFGIGAYGVAIAMTRLGPTWEALGLGLVASLALSFALALLVGLFSLRVRAIFFAMITLAVASAFLTLASQLSDITGGEDGLTFKVPELLSPSFEFAEQPFLGVTLDGRLLCYYLLFVTALLLLLALLRIVNSPFGRVLQAIRENEFHGQIQPALHEIHVAHDGAPRDFKLLGDLIAIGIGLLLEEVVEAHHALHGRAAERLGFGFGHNI